MKKIFVYGVSVLMSASLAVSCLNDLDTKPLDETVFTADKAFADPSSYDQYLNYAYSYFSLVSQGDAGSSDIAVSDAGQSEFIRQYTVLNEMTTDALKCVWGDDYVASVNYDRWTGSTSSVMAVYLRGMKAIAICNQFLDEAVSGDSEVIGRGHEAKLGDVRRYRAELRLLRAVYYSVMLDMFGNPPLVLPEHIGSSDFPRQMSTDFKEGRRMMFEWIEGELKSLTADDNLATSRSEVEYPRFTKGAAYAVLARLYLNAEVYTGTARWQDAMDASKWVIEKGGYELCPNYGDLFLQDNSTNGAQKEFIIAALYDCDTTQSYGGTTHLLYSAINSDMQPIISAALAEKYGKTYPNLNANEDSKEEEKNTPNIYRNQWNGYHCSEDFIAKNFDIDFNAVASGPFPEAKDGRALLYKFEDSFTNETSVITSGYSCIKWLPIDKYGNYITNANSKDFSSADFPLYRLAEMHLIYAEACVRLNGSLDADGRNYLLALGERANGAGYTLPASIDADWILSERVRELMWEGHRRVDLIRFGYFTSSSYTWPYKAGIADGRAAIDAHRTVFPIINSDLVANSNLVQNPGY